MRRLLRSLSTVLIVAGVLLIADAAATVVWQEPLSAVMAARSQAKLSDELDELQERTLAPADRRAIEELPSTERRIAFAARRLRERTAEGDALGRIVLPTLDKDFVVVAGDDPASLRKGPGVYPETPLPGQGGTTAVAGHRTTYLAPFRDLDDLRRGDHVRMEMPYGTFTYAVQGTEIVQPDDVQVIDPVGYERLVLTACHPLYSAAERIVVSARLVKVEPARDLRR
ncbi:MAG TPA: sortase [Capillimicrobium sp.]|nr:sortase [Capillimicrobium sp.]